MDKYELVLGIIEHPDEYTPQQLAEILSDPETREIYNLLCKADSAVEAAKEVDVNAEWARFSDRHAMGHRHPFLWPGSRAASIAAIVGTSIVAVAAGIAITVGVTRHSQGAIADDTASAPSVASVATDSICARGDTTKVALAPIMFENEALETIMKEVAATYRVEVKFNNKSAASLHLYYKLDPSLSLNDVVEQLNTFEQINITQQGNVLYID